MFPLLLLPIPAHRANRSLPVILYPPPADPAKINLPINLKDLSLFLNPENVRQLTTFTTPSTTTSPQKHHVLHQLFLKKPCKKRHSTIANKKADHQSPGCSIRSKTCAI
jgi:hypothetical protein